MPGCERLCRDWAVPEDAVKPETADAGCEAESVLRPTEFKIENIFLQHS